MLDSFTQAGVAIVALFIIFTVITLGFAAINNLIKRDTKRYELEHDERTRSTAAIVNLTVAIDRQTDSAIDGNHKLAELISANHKEVLTMITSYNREIIAAMETLTASINRLTNQG